MALSIEMVIEKRPGVLSRVIRALRDLDHTLETNSMGFHPEPDQATLTIISNGPEKSPKDIYERMRQVSGVAKLVSIQGEMLHDEPIATTPDAQKEQQQLQQQQKLNQLGQLPLVERIVESFPQIFPIVQKYEEGLSSGEEEAKVSALGVQVGMKMIGKMPGLAEYDHLEQAVELCVLPLIKPFAPGTRNGSSINIPVSVFNRRHLNRAEDPIFGLQAPGCYFMSGLIEGLLSGSNRHPKVQVSETRCRAHGDPACEYRIAKRPF